MPIVPNLASSQAKDVLSLTRALLNDSGAVVFTDSLLLPLLNSSYRSLQRELAENEVSVLAEQKDLTLLVNPETKITNTEISANSDPQLPSDCVAPLMLWERLMERPTDVFVPMEKFRSKTSLVNLPPSRYLRMWEWREDTIWLTGALDPITLRMRYEKFLPELRTDNDAIQIRSATDALGFATAALAARSRGARALAQDLLGTAHAATEKLIDRYVRPDQVRGVKWPRQRVIYL